MESHPFAEYVRILGRGKKGSRSFSFEEAETAMGMILRDEVEPIQLGAFLMLLRVKEESAAELGGFVSAVRKNIAPCPDTLKVDLDWSSYAGKRQQHPWFILAVLALADHGVRILMHGTAGHTPGRLYTEQALKELGYQPCQNWQQVEQAMAKERFAFYPMSALCPKLEEILHLKHVLGLRSPANSLARLLNPANAPASIHSVFHPRYGEIHQETLALLKQPNCVIFKGDGGEIERKPDATLTALGINNGQAFEERWPRQMDGRAEKLEALSTQALLALWHGETDPYGEAAVLGTLAVACKLLGKASTQEQAVNVARDIWDARNRSRLAG